MQLPYLNALNITITAQPGVLLKVAHHFQRRFDRAWTSADLRNLLPPEAVVDLKNINPEKEWAKVEKAGLQVITLSDRRYPKPLKQIADPPYLLYVKGNEKILQKDCFAIVGSRQPTDYGRRAVPAIAEKIAASGLVIVSGLAMGIDGLAHRAAVNQKLPTIAVLGGGISDHSIVYENKALARDILKHGGAIISEYALDVHGSQLSFPQRNRIISGLAKGVLIVEADAKSGSLITAKHALDQNRDVFAVPGSIFSARSEGPNNLLKMGAKAVSQAEDILTEYDIQYNLFQPQAGQINGLEGKILASIGKETVGLDEIIRQTQAASPEVIACLMNLELENKVRNLGNNKFCLYN